MKFLTLLLSLIDRLFSAWEQAKLRQEGRQEAVKEMADEVERQVELAQKVAATPDPDRDRRLRARFDDAAAG